MKRFFLLLAASLILFACSKEDSSPEGKLKTSENTEYQKFYASFETTPEAPGTKVYADGQLRLLWNAGDRISIFNQRTYNDQYEFDGEDGDNAGGFDYIPYSGFITSNPLDYIYAVYPYSNSTKINNDGDRITVNLPASQTYKENSFGIGANTMVAITDDNFLAFKNVCGYLKFRFWGDNIKISRIKLEGNNGEKIAGKAFVTPVLGSTPSVSMDGSATTSIIINSSNPDEPIALGTSSTEATEFIFVIPPTVFSSGFKVTIVDNLGGIFEKGTANSLEIKRNTMESMGAMKVTPNYDNVYVVFDDNVFKQFCLDNYDSDSDGKISVAEAKVPESMDLSALDDEITSLKGLEYFTSLTSLDCSNHQVENIPLGNLVALETFKCWYNTVAQTFDFSGNPALKDVNLAACVGLQSLDLSNNPNLESLRCQGGLTNTGEIAGRLASINLSNNPALTSMRIDQNLLTTLDLSHCPALRLLICDKNQLSSLDLSSNPAIIQVNCSSNKLTGINVSAANNPDLEVLYANDNLFSRLSITNMPSLVSLSLLSCPNLRDLFVNDNSLTSLIVDGSILLREINAANNQLETLDVSTNIHLQYLTVTNNKLSSLDLSNKLSLVGLNIGDNRFTSLDISNNSNLETVTAWNNQIASFTASTANQFLKNLNLADNSLSSLDVSMLTELSSLYCEGNQLSSLNLSSNANLVYLTCNNNQLTSLDLSSNPLLDGLICGNNRLTSLDLSGNPKMWQLDCSNNLLTSIDLSNHTDLWFVAIHGNNITTLDVSKSAGLMYIVAWPHPSTLSTIRKKTSANVKYLLAQGETSQEINPADYGTTIINVD
ncbi:MAG: hypothetical protein IJK39_03780 [Bacteroidales bacterium]|nr:hypothetical protein [Bacteroidales bacterium]